MQEQEAYLKGLLDCLNYLEYKILPRARSIEDLKKELRRMEAIVCEITAEELEKKLVIF